MSRRTQQVAGELRQAVQEVLARGLSDPRVRGLVTITEVTLSNDLTQATLMVSVLPEEHEELTLHGLTAASRFIRREAAERLAMHRLPQLAFKIDRRLKRQAGVLDAIARARQELADPAEITADTPDDTQPGEHQAEEPRA